MKIVHIVLSSGADYTDSFGYQENTLPLRHQEMGNEVTVISSTTSSLSKEKKQHTAGQYYVGPLKVIRLKPDFCFLRNRFEIFKALFSTIEQEKPDLIFTHGFTYLSISQLYKYKRSNPNVVIFFDCHATYENSFNRYPIIQKLLYKVVWGSIFSRYKGMFDKGYYIAAQVKRYLYESYNMRGVRLSHLPLGNKVDQELFDHRNDIKKQWRAKIGITTKYVIVTGGRFRESKQLFELLEAFSLVKSVDVTLCVFGRFETKEYEQKCKPFMSSNRVKNLGWLSNDETIELYLAADLAVFSGSQSVIWRTAIAAGLPTICRYSEGAEELDQGGNCILLNSDKPSLWAKTMDEVLKDGDKYKNMKSVAETKGRDFFSEEKIARKIIDDYRIIKRKTISK